METISFDTYGIHDSMSLSSKVFVHFSVLFLFHFFPDARISQRNKIVDEG